MKGRPEDWLATRKSESMEALVSAAVAEGFGGLYIDRLGYPDRGATVEADISRVLDGARPLVSPNERLTFFDLRMTSPG